MPTLLAAFLLGLFGSAAHCVGMCSGVAVLLGRSGAGRGARLLLAHSGRITSYTALGALAGALGAGLSGISGMPDHVGHVGMAHAGTAHAPAALPAGLAAVQGAVALLGAVLMGAMALALVGRIPSPERYLAGWTRRWGAAMRRLNRAESGIATPLAAGLLWGLLPCGLVLTALLTAALSGSAGSGALTLLAFGAGTWPIPLTIGVLGRSRRVPSLPWLRTAAALLVLALGVQLALRGLAAWGWVAHGQWGQFTLW